MSKKSNRRTIVLLASMVLIAILIALAKWKWPSDSHVKQRELFDRVRVADEKGFDIRVEEQIIADFEALPDEKREPLVPVKLDDDLPRGTTPVQAYGRRAYVMAQCGKHDQALADYRRAKELDPDGYGKVTGLSEIPATFAGHGLYEDAVMLFEDMLRANRSRMRVAYGNFLHSTKNDALRDPPRAVELIREAMEGKDQPHQQYAEALAAAGRFPEALQQLELSRLEGEARHSTFIERQKKDIALSEGRNADATVARLKKDMEATEKSHLRWQARMVEMKKLFEGGKALPPSNRY